MDRLPFLKRKLETKRPRIHKRYNYYEMKFRIKELGISTPESAKWLNEVVGWNGRAVDALADRLIFKTFRQDIFDLMEIFKQNNPDTFFDSAILEALIGSCSFVYISPDKDGFPRMQVIPAYDATGNINPITGFLTDGYAVLKKDDYGRPELWAYFDDKSTTVFDKSGKPVNRITHTAGVPLLVPIIYRPDSRRPFGHSRITRACMSYTAAAVRAIKRCEIAAEFGSFPQKYAVGMSQDAEPFDRWETAMSALWQVTKDDEGDHPVIGQFQQLTMTPINDQLKMFASLFAGETGLTLDDLGFVGANPASAEAIKSSHESLRLSAKKAQRGFGSGFLNVGIAAACLRDKFTYKRFVFADIQPVWEPAFYVDPTELSGLGDALIKITQAFPGFFTEEKLADLTGL